MIAARLLRFVLVGLAASLCLAEVRADDPSAKREKTIYEQAHGEIKEKFDALKSNVDSVAEKLGKFQQAITTWRTATTREAQQRGIEGFDGLLDDLNEDAIKKLIETGLGEAAVKQLEQIEEQLGFKLSDQVNLWALFKSDPRKAFDYMYDVSALERQLRQQGVFDAVGKIQGYLKKGEGYIKSAGELVQFVRLFDPTAEADDAPTASLKRLKAVLEKVRAVSDKVPGIGHLLDFYIQATDAFVGALDRLDKQIKEVRQGSLCGQLGVDKDVQAAFSGRCPGCDCLTFFAIAEGHPLLKPIRGWQGTERPDVFLFLDSGRHALIDGGIFGALYRYYAALRSSSVESNRGLVDAQRLIERAMAIQGTGAAIDDAGYRKLYEQFEDEKKGLYLQQALETAGVLTGFELRAPGGQGVYRLNSRRADEFAALCFFDPAFHAFAKELIDKYGGHVRIRGELRSQDPNVPFRQVRVKVAGAPALKLECTGGLCRFEHVVKRNERFRIEVEADCFKDFAKDDYVANELFDTIPTIFLEPEDPCKVLRDLCADTRARLSDMQKRVAAMKADGAGQRLPADWQSLEARGEPARQKLLAVWDSHLTDPKFVGLVDRLGRSLKAAKDAATGPDSARTLEEGIAADLDYLVVEGGKCLVDCKVCEEGGGTNDCSTGLKALRDTRACLNGKGLFQDFYDIPEHIKRRNARIDAFVKAKAEVETAITEAEAYLGAAKPVDTAKADPNLAASIDAALKARDWRRLSTMLEELRKSELRLKNPEAYKAADEAITAALEKLKDERMKWALAWKGYIEALDAIDSRSWEVLTREVDKKRDETEQRCNETASSSEDPNKRVARCKKVAYDFYASCLGDLPDRHFEERRRIRTAKEQLPDAVQQLHSAGFGSHKAWFEKVEEVAKTHGLTFPYPDPVVPRLQYTSSCAAPDLPKGTRQLRVTVRAPEAPLPPGQSATVNVVVEGGKPPYRYSWSGAAGSGEQATVTPRWAGDWTVLVEVTDAEGKTGEGSATVRAAPAKFALAGLPGQVFYGSRTTFGAQGQDAPPSSPVADPCAGRPRSNSPFDPCNQIEVDPNLAVSVSGSSTAPAPTSIAPATAEPVPKATAPAAGGRRYVWQAEPGVTFDPATTTDPRTTVTWDRMGQVKVWCEVHEQREGAFHTIGECDQETVNVVAPAFSLRFDPPSGQGRIGQEVKARIVANPEVPAKLIDYRWLEPATSNRREATDNASEIGFVPKDAKPIVLKALARVPFHGDDIATIDASYAAASYAVTVSVEERGPKPMVWDPVKGGLVPLARGSYAADEQVGLRATLEGDPKPAEVRWRWTVNDGTTIGNPISQTPTVSRHEPGAIIATVEALDRDGNVLGSGSASLSVTISSDDLAGAKAKAEAAKLVGEAKAAWARKDPSKALALIEKAQKLVPKDPEIGRLANDYRDGKARFDRAATLREEGGRLQNEKKLTEALDRYKQAQALWPDPRLADHIAKVEAALAKEREAETKAKALRDEATRLAQAGKLDEAIAKVEESLRVRVTPEAEQQLRDLKTARDRKKAEEAQKQARAKALRDEGAALQAKGELPGALAKFKDAQQLLPDPKLADHIAKVEAALKERQALLDQAEALRRNPQAIGCGKGLGDATALADRLQKVDAGKAAVLRKDIATVAMATASSLVGNQLDFAKGVPCLEVAQKLDPGNAQIGQELERARQIQAGWRELQTLPTRMDAAAAAGRILEADQIRSRAPELARGIDQAPPVRDLLASLIAKWDRAMAVYRAHRDSLMAELQAMLDGRRYQELIARGDAELAREWYPGDAQLIRELQSHAREKMAYEASQKAPPRSPAATPGGTAPTATAGQGAVPGKATGAGTSAGGGCAGLQRTDVTRRTWRFGRSNNTVVADSVRLTEAGRMEGYYHPNEHAWSLENGVLVFRNPADEAITRFTQCTTQDGRLVLRGPYALDKSFEHILTEIAVDASPTAHPATTGTPGGLQGSTVTGAGVTSGVPTGSMTAGVASPGGGVQGGAGSIQIEACVDGSDWLRIESGRLVHEHRAFAQIGAHPGCPASHAVAGGGLLVNGQSVTLTQLPYPVGIASLDRFELAQGRGAASMDGAKGLLLDDDGLGGPAVYVVRLFGGATTAGPATTPPKPPTPKLEQVGNIGGVTNGPTVPTTFTFAEPVRLVWLQTYHWNGARGATPGRIGLRQQDGTVYGPWPTRGLPGQGGVPNAYWRAEPGVVLKPGTYTVTDSDPSTWATNAQAGNKGFADLEVIPVTDAAAATPPAGTAAPAPADAATPMTPPATAVPASTTVLTGRWEALCDGNEEVYPVTMRQDGNRLRVVVEGQAEYQGTFDGHRLKGTSADGLDGFDGTAVSTSELRIDWEGRTSADSRHVYHNSCTLRRKGAPPAESVVPPKPAAPAAPTARTPPPTSTKAPALAPPTAPAPKGGTVPCKRGGNNPFEEDICIEVDKMVPAAPR